MVLVFTLSCNQESAQEFNPKSSLIFEQVEYYPNLGERHNQVLENWFIENNANLKFKDIDSRLEHVDKYFKDNFNYNTRDLKYRIFNISQSIDNGRLFNQNLSFDVFVYLENNKDKIQTNTYIILHEFFTKTSEIENFEDELIYIEELENRVIKDNNISLEDKNGIRNLLLVYKASYTYWKENLSKWIIAKSGEAQNSRILEIKEEDYQKIAWADIVEGTAGGLLGGPLGAFIGLAAGSITMAIGLS